MLRLTCTLIYLFSIYESREETICLAKDEWFIFLENTFAVSKNTQNIVRNEP